MFFIFFSHKVGKNGGGPPLEKNPPSLEGGPRGMSTTEITIPLNPPSPRGDFEVKRKPPPQSSPTP